ncbi:hypothetical protein Droror1_Dr00024264 [Drosera rotundifolia]
MWLCSGVSAMQYEEWVAQVEPGVSRGGFGENEHSSLRAENVSLKADIEKLKEEFNSIRTTDERVVMLQNKSLCEKVEDLQSLLDKATKQADEAVCVLRQNHELEKKVEMLEEYLLEASVLKLSPELLKQVY